MARVVRSPKTVHKCHLPDVDYYEIKTVIECEECNRWWNCSRIWFGSHSVRAWVKVSPIHKFLIKLRERL